jgi:DNA-binding IclR family transcriptional regulator
VAASATPPTVLELARDCGINRSTAWRLLRTLEHHGLVDRDPITQRYTVGYGAISVAAAVTDDALVRRVRPLLAKLAAATGESVTLAKTVPRSSSTPTGSTSQTAASSTRCALRS